MSIQKKKDLKKENRWKAFEAGFKTQEYDERQLQAQGTACQYGFITAMALVFISLIVHDTVGLSFTISDILNFCLWIPFAVCTVTMILKDAYDGVIGKRGIFFCRCMGVCGAITLLLVPVNLVNGETLVECSRQIVSGCCELSVGIAYWIKERRNKEEE